MRKQKRNKNARPATSGPGNVMQGWYQPTTSSTLAFKKRFRFLAVGGTLDAGITVPMIKDLMGIAAGANSVIMFIDAFQIVQVEMRSSAALGGSPNTLTLEWNGTEKSTSRRITNTSFGLQPAIISSRPPANTLAALWHSGAETETLFSMQAPGNTIVDLVLKLTLTDDTTVGLTATTSALTAYDVVVKYLDGVCAGAAGILVPQGWQHTFAN